MSTIIDLGNGNCTVGASETMDADDYENWLVTHHAATARRLAEEARAGVPLTGDVLADLLDSLAAIAERAATP